MKFVENGYGPFHLVELTRRNLETLLAKLDDPDSQRTIINGIAVRAVENEEHYATRAPGPTLVNGEWT